MKKGLISFLQKIADVTNNSKFVRAMIAAFTSLMPFTLVGSFGTLFATLLCNTNTGLAAVKGFEWCANLLPAFNALSFATITCMTLLFTFVFGERYGKEKQLPQYIGGLTSLTAYITVVPQSLTAVIEESSQVFSNVLPSGSINSSGLFLSFIIVYISVGLLSKLSSIEKLKIKMPDAVPEGIANSFNSLVPIIITEVLITAAGFLFLGIFKMNILDFIYKILQAPLMALAQTSIGIVFIRLFSQLFWFLGIHGGLATSAIINPVFSAALAENVEAVNAGLKATNIVTQGTFTSFGAIGGAGNTMALIIAIFLVSKRDDWKEVAKFSFIPGIFGINEPMVFGLPIMFNAYLAIPFFVCPTVCILIGYAAQVVGFIPCSIAQASLGIPMFLRPFLYFGGSFNAALLQLVCLILSIVIYLPFVKMANNELKKERTAE